VTGRSHLSIGEVLSLLQEEFPDVTISKIRFLESQGLVDPERTPSGYRKFYEPDIERLRWVLRQQRDAFLPLKVIKGRLEGTGSQLSLDGMTDEGMPGPEEGNGAEAAAVTASGTGRRRGARSVVVEEVTVERFEVEAVVVTAEEAAPSPAPLAAPPAAPAQPAGARRRSERGGGRPGPAVGPSRVAGALQPEQELSLEELVRDAGVEVETVRDLERYGLVSPRSVAGTDYYRPDAVVVARLAASFARHGVEARHLRAYKGAAEREAGLVQQVIAPLVRQRNPDARQAAAVALEELSQLGGELRTALLRSALSELR
jgi:DNA-binding transcriptional MerR regulator